MLQRAIIMATVSILFATILLSGCIDQEGHNGGGMEAPSGSEEYAVATVNLTYLDDTSDDFQTWDVDICTPEDYGVLIVRYNSTDNSSDTILLGVVSAPEGWRVGLERDSVQCSNGSVVPVIITYFTNASVGFEGDIVISAVSQSHSDVMDTITLHVVVSHNGMPVAKKGDKVIVSYVLYDTEGNQLDSGTLPATAGERYVGPAQQLGYIDGFYLGLLGMYRGETKPIRVPPELAYGTDGSSSLSGETLIFVLTMDLIVPTG